MKKIYLFSVLIPAVFILLSAKTGSWIPVKQKGAVKVYSRPVEGSAFHEWRAEADYETDFATALAVMKDYKSYCKWFGMCRELRVLNSRSASDMDIYIVLAIPMIDDRDAVATLKITYDEKRKRARADFSGYNSSYGTASGFVRIKKFRGSFSIEGKGAGGTRGVYEYFADIGGSISPSIVNSSGYKQPMETMTGAIEYSRRLESRKYTSP